MTADLYQTLGVDPSASAAEIKTAYRRLALQCHPDRHPNDPGKENQFKAVASAYEILGDAAKRTAYDLQRRFGVPPRAAGGSGGSSRTSAGHGAGHGAGRGGGRATSARDPGGRRSGVSPEDLPTETSVRGRVTYVIAANTNWCCGRLRTDDGRTILFVGNLVVQEHDPVVFCGKWVVHPRFGPQFKVDSFTFNQKLDPAGLAHYLANHPGLYGIGPAKAEAIAQAFGADFDRVIDEEPERVAAVAHLSMEVVGALRTEWLRTRTLNASLTWLASFGLTHKQIERLIDTFGNDVVAILKADPYLIIGEVPSFGFKRADEVARKMGIPKDHPGRLRAGLRYVVQQRIDDGDCYVDYGDLIRRANELLVMDVRDSRARIEQCLEALIADKKLACDAFPHGEVVAEPGLRKMEMDLAALFAGPPEPNAHFRGEDADALDAYVGFRAADLKPAQHRAVIAALRHRFLLICGGAGSGKTFTIRTIHQLYREAGLRVVLAAPTGKAAKRMEEVVGVEAFTIHRLLGYNGAGFGRASIDADLVITDEASMIDVPLAWHFFRAIQPRTSVVLVGDHNQLPPVGPGNILRDLIDRRPIPTVVLDEIVRQAGALKANSIALLGGVVRATEPPIEEGFSPWVVKNHFSRAEDLQRFVLGLFERPRDRSRGIDPLRDVQVLTPMRKGPLGTAALNALLQATIQRNFHGVEVPAPPKGHEHLVRFLLHDRVIQCRNNYDLGVMNGAVGIVTGVEGAMGTIVVDFDGEEVTYDREAQQQLDLAYALTVHKSQGSQFPCAVVVVHKSHSQMHHRNLLYTAVTRAQRVAILLGDKWGIDNCVERRLVDARKTFLSIVDFDAMAERGDHQTSLGQARAPEQGAFK